MQDLDTNPVVRAGSREPHWLVRRRATAMQHFAQLGLPSRHDEAWRFTDLRPLTAGDTLPAPAPEGNADPALVTRHLLAGDAHRVVLVNGRVVRELCSLGALPPGAWLGSLGEAVDLRPDLAEAAFGADDTLGSQPFAALNAASFTDGFVLALEPGVTLDRPVEVLHLANASGRHAFHLRSTVVARAGSRASVVETFVGTGVGWTNAVTTLELGEGADVRHMKVQAEAADAIHLGIARARLARRSRYACFLLTTGARLSRQDVQVVMEGEAACLSLNGAYLLAGDQEATIAALVDHEVKGGETKELVKGVLTDRAHGVFLGSVLVREGADQTDARQLNRNLMLSEAARVDTKPELMIHADDVKCSHGATVGDLDEAALFYLQSRGIAPRTARHMLVEAFAADVFDTASLAPDIDAHARRYLEAWLAREGASA